MFLARWFGALAAVSCVLLLGSSIFSRPRGR
jgi:hypothetical protein